MLAQPSSSISLTKATRRNPFTRRFRPFNRHPVGKHVRTTSSSLFWFLEIVAVQPRSRIFWDGSCSQWRSIDLGLRLSWDRLSLSFSRGGKKATFRAHIFTFANSHLHSRERDLGTCEYLSVHGPALRMQTWKKRRKKAQKGPKVKIPLLFKTVVKIKKNKRQKLSSRVKCLFFFFLSSKHILHRLD